MSVDMAVSIEGLPELRAKLEQLDEGMKEQVRYALAFEGEKIKTAAQSLCPVRTGYLRSTIFAQIEDWFLKVGATAHYATYVEFGTRYMQGYRFLSHALWLRMQALINTVNGAIAEAIRGASR